MQHMREAATRRSELEREHADAVAELRRKQEDVKYIHKSKDTEKRKAQEAVQSLESKVRELQKKCELQIVRHDELVLEMAALRRAQSKQSWRSQRSQSADLPRDGSYQGNSLDKMLSSGETWNSSLSSSTLGISTTSSSLQSLDLGISRSLGSTPSHSASPLRSTGSLSSTDFSGSFFSTNAMGTSSLTSKSASSTNSLSLQTSSLLDSTSHEIDRILARIDQDNRILAELEKSRATVGSPVSSANIERLRAHIEEDNKQLDDLSQPLFPLKPSYSSPAIDQLLHEPQRSKQMYYQLSRHRSPIKQSVTVQHLNQLMEKLEQDNRILAELDRKRANIGISPGSTITPLGGQLTIPSIMTPGATILSMTPSSSTCSTPIPNTPSLLPTMPTVGGILVGTVYNAQLANTTTYAVPATASLFSQPFNKEENAITTEEILRAIDYIDLPGRGRCRIYIARYSYDPLKQSPNDNPEAELSLNAGDYLIITGEMDEDGFFNGELLDGRKGLVPSNFVEKLTGEDLFDFQATVIYGNRDSDDSSASFSFAQDLDISGSDDFHVLPPEDFHRMNDYIDLGDIQEVDEENLSDFEREGDGLVPHPPQRLILERQLNKSILIGWLPPETHPTAVVDTYHVYVDGVLKASVKATERTRALVEGVDSTQPHRISVRSVAPTGHHSADAACTIVFGKDVPLAPSCVKASNITSTSAIISWLPSNSNFQHVVAVNSVEVRSVKPGTFRHTISGLAPNTSYRVSVRAKPGRLLYNDEKNPRKLEMLTTYVDFRTLPKGLPDPPLNIQIEAGPQDGTLLVTWLPVVVNTSAANAAPVTGYAVYAGGKKIAEVDSPTGDHALFDLTTVHPFERKSVTVRTKSGENMSSDSMPCVIPTDLLRGQGKSMIHTEERTVRERRGSSSDSESDTELAELLNHVTRRAQAFDPVDLSPFGSQKELTEEYGEEGSRSELPDIVEEIEDEVAERMEEREKSHVINENGLGQDRGMSHDRTDARINRQSPKVITDVRSRDRPQGRSSPPRIHREHVYRTEDSLMPPNGKRRLNRMINERRNSSGQVIIEPDENLSDKEIYPSAHMNIPSIEITKDTASEGCNSLENFSEEEYERHERRMASAHYARTHKPKVHGGGHYYSDGPTGRRHMLPEHEHAYYNHRGGGMHRRDDYRSNGYRDSYHNHPSEYSSRSYPPDNRPRWFVALFDYDPMTMSPNPDAAEEELPFQEGQLIKIYGDKDADGFYRGEANGQIGYVPCNMVSEVQVEEDDLSHQLINENVPATRSHHTHHSMASTGNRGAEQWGNSMPVRRMVALYDYDPQELSPNVDAEMELAFSTGDIIYVYGEMDEDGFFMGELNGVRGLVPSNFLTEAPPDYRDTRTREKLGPPGVGNSHERRYNIRGPPIAPTTPHQSHPKINFLQTKDVMPLNVQDTRETTMKGATTFLTGLFTPQRETTMTQEEMFNAGKQRPTTLDLKGKLWAYQPFGGTDNKAATNQVGGTQQTQDEKKGILSSVKDMFKPLWKN